MADVNKTVTVGIGLGAATFGTSDPTPSDDSVSQGFSLGASLFNGDLYSEVSEGIGLSVRVSVPDGDLANGRYRR